MKYIGLDLHKRKIFATVLDGDGTILAINAIGTNEQDIYYYLDNIKSYLCRHAGDCIGLNTSGHFLEIINPATIAITVVSLIVLLVSKIHPILVILAAGAIGVILHYIGAL